MRRFLTLAFRGRCPLIQFWPAGVLGADMNRGTRSHMIPGTRGTASIDLCLQLRRRARVALAAFKRRSMCPDQMIIPITVSLLAHAGV